MMCLSHEWDVFTGRVYERECGLDNRGYEYHEEECPHQFRDVREGCLVTTHILGRFADSCNYRLFYQFPANVALRKVRKVKKLAITSVWPGVQGGRVCTKSPVSK